jgi:hypothetical protein
VVTYRASLDVPADLVSWLENLIATRRSERGGAGYALTSFDQAVLTLVWFAKGDTYAELGAHFGVSTDTAWRYVGDTIDALVSLAPTLADAIDACGEQRRLLLDGTLIRTWRCAALATDANPDPLFNGKHRCHGLNVQALSTPGGELVFLGQARPGSVHDLAAARADRITDAVTEADIETLADTGYQGAGGTIRTPIRRPAGKSHNGWERAANSALARLRAPAERPFAQLKRYRVLHQLRISPNRATATLHALLTVMRKRASLART